MNENQTQNQQNPENEKELKQEPKMLEKAQESYTFGDSNQQFLPLSSKGLLSVLGLTIKQDEVNKLVTFLCELSAYTDNSQFNISYNAPSSSGKSFIPTEVAALFPESDVVEVGYCSPTAFFHDHGAFDKEKQTYTVDLSGKILIFLDQPHTMLLQHLRPLLSHDKKEIQIKITDKKKMFGLVTKNIILRGFPAVIFCTAGLRIDEQEATRFLLLSPEINQEKIRQGVNQIIRKEADNDEFKRGLESSPERNLLKQRIEAIKNAGIKEVKLTPELQEKIRQKFFGNNKRLKPRHQRDIKRLMALIKLFAVLNYWWREKTESYITASQADVDEAFAVWDEIAESQELNLPPYVYAIYKEVLVPAWHEQLKENQKQSLVEHTLLNDEKPQAAGLSRRDIAKKHMEVYGRHIPDWQLHQQIIPMLESAGLVIQEPDPKDRRRILIYSTTPLYISGKEKYIEPDGRAALNQQADEDGIDILDIPSAVESINL